jgi:hypothetical protein
MYQNTFRNLLKNPTKTSGISKKDFSRRLSELIIAILVAFACGNIFGMYTKTVMYPEIIIITTLVSIELVSFFKYSRTLSIGKTPVLSILNAIKRGFLIGLFVEAFKLGS